VTAVGNPGDAGLAPPAEYLDRLAELAVGLGANIQPGQVVGITVQSGQEAIARATAEKAYARGAKFVDLWLVDLHVKHSRLKHADPDTLTYLPSWIGERMLKLGELEAARLSFQGPPEPTLMDDIEPTLLGLDQLPRLRESVFVTGQQTTNWNITPFPNPNWARLMYPELPVEAAYAKLWQQIAFVCRLDEPDPTAAWKERLAQLEAHAEKLTALRLDSLHFVGPGTDLTIGLLPSSRWVSGRGQTRSGITYTANLPTEEVFTAPDPERAHGHVTATKPLLVPGSAVIEGLTVSFENGRVSKMNATKGHSILETMTKKDDGASRLGEVALVDREGRIGQTGSVFYDILLDENSASHIAVGAAYTTCVSAEEDRARANKSAIHVDFMIGSNEVDVDGVGVDGSVMPLLRGGAWQV